MLTKTAKYFCVFHAEIIIAALLSERTLCCAAVRDYCKPTIIPVGWGISSGADDAMTALCKDAALRWGVVGCGRISSDFVNALSLLPAAEHQVCAAGASTVERASAFVREHSLAACAAFGSYDHVYQSPHIDVVYVGLLNEQHEESVLAALAAGKHVLCEKPLGRSAAEVRRMVAAARQADRFLMEGFWSRCFPAWRRLSDALAARQVGEARLLTADFGSDRSDERAPTSRVWRSGLAEDVGCYLLLLASTVFGAQTPAAISAHGWTRHGVDDTASITLIYPNDRMAQLLYSASAATRRAAQICGSEGIIEVPMFWCPDRFTVKRHDQQSVTEVVVPHPEKKGLHFNFTNTQCLLYEAQCVRSCLLDGLKECPLMPLDESITISEVMTEVKRQLLSST